MTMPKRATRHATFGALLTAAGMLASALSVAALSPRPTCAAGSKLDPTREFAIRWWTVEDGLPETPLTSLDVAPDGSVWCATRTSLSRFDGQAFDGIPAAVTAPIHRQIGDFLSIGFDGLGTLWIVGREGAAASQRETRDHANAAFSGDWTIYPATSGPLEHVIFDRQGAPRFVGANRVLTRDGRELVAVDLPRGVDAFKFYDACIDSRTDDLWLWGFGVARRIVGGQRRDDAAQFRGKIINIAPGSRGVWAGLVDAKAKVVEGAALFQDGRWTEWPMPERPATQTREGHVVEAADGTLWLSSHASIHALRDGHWRTAVDGLLDFSLTTQRMKASRNGTVWVACSGGLLAIDRTILRVSPLPPARVLHRRSDGSLLAGIPGAIVSLEQLADGTMTRGETVATLPDSVVPTAIAEQGDGTLFVGTRDSFIYRLRNGEAAVVAQTPGSRLEVRNVHALACDAADRIWAGTDYGLAVYDAENDCFNPLPAFPAATRLPVIGLAAEADGSLLVAMPGHGIDRLTADGQIRHEIPAGLMPGRRTVRFCRSPDDTIWAAGDLGLLRWGRGGRITVFDERQGLVERSLVAAMPDDRGRLWLACRDGHLQGVRLADLEAAANDADGVVRGIVLGPLDGLGETELLGGLARAADGGLLVTTAAGVGRLDPPTGPPAPAAAAAPISIVQRDERSGTTLEYASVTTDEFEPPLYQTRLVGIDPGWSAPGHHHARTYAAIPPGRHRFEVRQLRGDAVTDFSVGGLDVVVPIPYWRTPWFMAASLCGVAGLGAAVAWWAGRLANRRRIALLEQEQERQRDRSRIARDIHDSLGARLTQIAMTSDLMRRSATQPTTAETVPLDEQLDEIYRTAQSLTRSVDEIVWAVNPANDTLRRFCTFVAHDVEAMARGGGLDLGIDVDDDDDVPDLVLPSSARHHLCLIVREAVANVLKHAHATTLDFRLHIRSGRLEMTIADDGHGFCPGPVSGQGHNGLANMQARATDLGGTVAISSVPGQGTKIRISAPLPTGTGVSAPAADRRPLGIETDARYDRSGRYS